MREQSEDAIVNPAEVRAVSERVLATAVRTYDLAPPDGLGLLHLAGVWVRVMSEDMRNGTRRS